MIPFSPPRIDQKTIDEVVDTLKSGWITTGPKTKKFESLLRDYTGAKAVLCLNSATAGLELMLRWLGVKEGDEVIVPAYTYAATANVVVHCGAKPVMVDVLDDFTMDPEKVKQAITPNTKAIMPVDIGGFPADYDELLKVIEEARNIFQPLSRNQEILSRIAIIADAAHSVGARFHGKPVGENADAVIFSFHAVKNLTTAEGGAICLNLPEGFDNNEIYAWLNTRSLHGQNKDALAKLQRASWEYDIVDAGYKCNMTDIQASIGLVEFGRYEPETLPRRKAVFAAYDQHFLKKEWAIRPLFQDKDRESSYHLYLLRVKGINEAKRNAIIQEIFDRDVSVNVHYKPLPMMTYYKQAGYQMKDYPKAFALYENEISLPVYFDLTDEQIRTVVSVVTQAVEKHL